MGMYPLAYAHSRSSPHLSVIPGWRAWSSKAAASAAAGGGSAARWCGPRASRA